MGRYSGSTSSAELVKPSLYDEDGVSDFFKVLGLTHRGFELQKQTTCATSMPIIA